jgi:hypothetical protein
MASYQPSLGAHLLWCGVSVSALFGALWALGQIGLIYHHSRGPGLTILIYADVVRIGQTNWPTGFEPGIWTLDGLIKTSRVVASGPYYFQFARTPFSVPVWFPLLLSVPCTGWGWWIRRVNAQLHPRCDQCHYDRTGLSLVAPCPECGAPAINAHLPLTGRDRL